MIQAGLRYVLVPINSLAIDIGGDGDKLIDSSRFSQRVFEVTAMIDRITQSFPPEYIPTELSDILTQLRSLFYQINHQAEIEAGGDGQRLISTTIQAQLNKFGQQIQARISQS